MAVWDAIDLEKIMNYIIKIAINCIGNLIQIWKIGNVLFCRPLCGGFFE